MLFTPPLKPARLIKRYQRFLADVITPEGEIFTLHCANTGAMTGCATPGDTVWYSTSGNNKRKYAHSWELTHTQHNDWICVNTLRANSLVREAIEQNVIKALSGYSKIASEIKYGNENSRIDLLLQGINRVDCYVEVKSVTLWQEPWGYFPDAITLRGQKHLRELQNVVAQGQRAVLFFAVLHSAIHQVAPAHHIDRQYATLLRQVRQSGVEILCYRAGLSPESLSLCESVPFFVDEF